MNKIARKGDSNKVHVHGSGPAAARRTSTTNPSGAAARLLLAVLTVLPLVGCQGDKAGDDDALGSGRSADRTAEQAAPSLETPDLECSVALDYAVLRHYRRLAPRLFSATRPPTADIAAFLDEPAYATLLRSHDKDYMDRSTLTRELKGVSSLPDPGGVVQRLRPRHGPIKDNFLYLRLREEALWDFLADYARPGAKNGPCEILRLLDGYVRPERLPERLELVFLAMAPELRFTEGLVLVDAGVALAAGGRQLNRLIASLIYKDLEKPAGPAPHETGGAGALAATFARVCQEGVAAWMEGYMDVSLDSRHPDLGRDQPNRLHAFVKGRNRLDDFNKFLPMVTLNPAKQGNLLDDLLRGTGSYEAASFSLAAVIVHRLGEDRLRDSARSPARFLRAYQEAALQNEPGAAATVEDMPALDQEGLDRLIGILAAEGYPAD